MVNRRTKAGAVSCSLRGANRKEPQTENDQPRIAQTTIYDLPFTIYGFFDSPFTIYGFCWQEGDPRWSFRSRNWTCIYRWVTFWKPQPLAILNAEELHWQAASVSHFNGVGSIIVTRWRAPQTISLRRRGYYHKN